MCNEGLCADVSISLGLPATVAEKNVTLMMQIYITAHGVNKVDLTVNPR